MSSLFGIVLALSSITTLWPKISHKKNVNPIGQRFLDFILKYAQPNTDSIATDLALLCAPTCKKIINGQVVSENRTQLEAQMQAAKRECVETIITPDKIIEGKDGKSACIKVYMNTKNNGLTYATIYMLSLDQNGFIQEIDAVYNEI